MKFYCKIRGQDYLIGRAEEKIRENKRAGERPRYIGCAVAAALVCFRRRVRLLIGVRACQL